MQRYTATVMVLLSMTTPFVGGCPSSDHRPDESKPIGPPRPLEEIVRVIQTNAAKVDQPIWSSSVNVNARFKDQDNKQHTFNLEGSLLFDRPRRLRMDLRPGMGDQAMQLGSNDVDFWYWVEPELHRMRWGRHVNVGKPCFRNVSIRPDQVAAALGFSGLPGASEGLQGPRLVPGHDYDKLLYVRSVGGRIQVDREYWVERAPPYLVRLVLFRDPSGKRAASAYLDDYRQAWDGGPMLAHAINLDWPGEQGNLTMRISRMRPQPGVDPSKFSLPGPEHIPSGITDIQQIDSACP